MTSNTRLALAAVVAALAAGPVLATCNPDDPNSMAQSDTRNYAKFYVQYPDDIGTSWRLYVRPRNGACLSAVGNGFQSPTHTTDLSDGSKKSAGIHPGDHNCDDDYKSYMSVDIPSASTVWAQWTKKQYYKNNKPSADNLVYVGFKVDTTRNSGYSGVIALMPGNDGTDSTKVMVYGLCTK